MPTHHKKIKIIGANKMADVKIPIVIKDIELNVERAREAINLGYPGNPGIDEFQWLTDEVIREVTERLTEGICNKKGKEGYIIEKAKGSIIIEKEK
jgi:hypothetical protein